jgi:hypothetical protein
VRAPAGFHAACVDTWLFSSSTCPSCHRTLVLIVRPPTEPPARVHVMSPTLPRRKPRPPAAADSRRRSRRDRTASAPCAPVPEHLWPFSAGSDRVQLFAFLMCHFIYSLCLIISDVIFFKFGYIYILKYI